MPRACSISFQSTSVTNGGLMDSYRIVSYGVEHKPLVAELARHLWSSDVQLNARYLDWKYHRNPYIREPLLYLAFSGEQLVGMRGAFGSKWEVGDPPECFILPYPDDLIVDPAHRVKGLHRRLMEFALDDLKQRGFHYVVNLSASQVTALGSLRMKWRNAGGFKPVLRRTRLRASIDRLVSHVRRWPFLWRWAEDIEGIFGLTDDRVFDRIEARLLTGHEARQKSSLLIRSTPLVREMAELLAGLPRDGRIRHIRDEAYFEWRYRNPLNTYRFVYAAGDRLEGFLVLKTSWADRGRVRIVDWEGRDDRVLEELLAAVVTCGGFQELHAWTATLAPSACSMYERHGFEPARRGYETSVLVRSLQEGELNKELLLGGRRLDSVESWDLRMINSMQG